jgi:antitoxin component of MazEF toxin-antitoxin module
MPCYYRYYMKPIQLKVARIGNSRGVRLPAATLARYDISDAVVMEERSDGILLRPQRSTATKLTWDETANAMAASHENWNDCEVAAADGLHEIPWDSRKPKKVAEAPTVEYSAAAKTRRKKRS